MEQEIIKMAASQGFFAVLFVGLLFYVLRQNSVRETKYQETIDRLAKSLDGIESIRQDVSEIKTGVKALELVGRG